MPKKFFGGPGGPGGTRALNAVSSNASGWPPVSRVGLGSQGGAHVRLIPKVVPKKVR